MGFIKSLGMAREWSFQRAIEAARVEDSRQRSSKVERSKRNPGQKEGDTSRRRSPHRHHQHRRRRSRERTPSRARTPRLERSSHRRTRGESSPKQSIRSSVVVPTKAGSERPDYPRELFKTPVAVPKRSKLPEEGTPKEWKHFKAENSLPKLVSPLPPTPVVAQAEAPRTPETKPPIVAAPPPPPVLFRREVIGKREGTPPRHRIPVRQAPVSPPPARAGEHTPPRIYPSQGIGGQSQHEQVYPPALERRSPWSRALFRAHYLALRLAIEWGYRPRPPTWPRFSAAELGQTSQSFRAVLEAFRNVTYPPQGEVDAWSPPWSRQPKPDSSGQRQ
ncbi:serine/arginine repetitive matrix protein 1-like [Phlebotomus papatasi]|uniref:serine/arginine repetitive matrix protein 1-like n=1 Tax=Phlebotomus papatasi TaxID=29031 RepID=UPI0024844A3A|nr:serine/arginine repetitive matrix protein 1-like [Phlebotomus papatasi]